MSDEFPPALPHTPPEEILPDVFLVRGGFRVAPLTRITRNMIILRHEGALTLINSVRPTAEGEAALAALGEVKHLVRIGAFHGADDPWFQDHYDLTLWTLPGMTPPGDEELSEDHAPPVPGLRVVPLRDARRPEACIFLDRAGGVVISCDSLQNWSDTEGCSLIAKAAVRLMGLKPGAMPGRPWLKEMEHRDGPPLRADFARLRGLNAKLLIPGHGAPLRGGVGEAIAATIARLWPA